MPSQAAQRRAFRFLRERFQSQRPFTKAEFQQATGWPDGTLDTYWTKHFRDLIEDIGGGSFRVTETFAAYASWRRFRTIVSQSRRLITAYRENRYDAVVTYEFYMPLKHETALKNTLDSLFFRDVIEARLRASGQAELREAIPLEPGETDDAYFARLLAFVDANFGGYSIYHVYGRFRAGGLRTITDAAQRLGQGRRYLVDETTAVARFIFPCDPADATKIEFLFTTLFTRSITRLVAGEDVIWMVESGLNDRVHVWEAVQNEPDEE